MNGIKIFISYSRLDHPFVRAARGRSPRAADSRPGSTSTTCTSTTATPSARRSLPVSSRPSSSIVVLSPDSVESDDVWREVEVAGDLRRRIVPLALRRCEIPTRLRYLLAGLERIDFATTEYALALRRLEVHLDPSRAEPDCAEALEAPLAGGARWTRQRRPSSPVLADERTRAADGHRGRRRADQHDRRHGRASDRHIDHGTRSALDRCRICSPRPSPQRRLRPPTRAACCSETDRHLTLADGDESRPRGQGAPAGLDPPRSADRRRRRRHLRAGRPTTPSIAFQAANDDLADDGQAGPDTRRRLCE